MRKIFFVILACVAFCTAQAQRFEWVRTYTGPDINDDPTNKIVGSCVDSAGNLYILGEFSPQAKLCGVDLLPHEIITTPLRKAVVIAKLSTEGELVWHKAIYGSSSSCAFDMKRLGDTAIMVMTGFRMSHNFNGFLYYLDTLLTSDDAGFLQSADSTRSVLTNGFITFDMDGNVTEQHFLEVGYVDSSGHTINISDQDPGQSIFAMSASSLSSLPFGIDSEGNIYIIRYANDQVGIYPFSLLSIADGSLEALKIMVDGTRQILYCPQSPVTIWNVQILKFAPHFDSLITAIYIFDSTDGFAEIQVFSIAFDSQGTMYINMSGSELPPLRINGTDSLQVDVSSFVSSWMVSFTSELQPKNLIQLSHIGDSSSSVSRYLLLSYADDSSNSLFVSGNAHWPEGVTVNDVVYDNTPLNIANGSSYWIRLNKENLQYVSHGIAHPNAGGRVAVPYLTFCKNRIISQLKYTASIDFGDTTLFTPQNNYTDVAFAIWGSDGQELSINNYRVASQNSLVCAPLICDSIVYLLGTLYDNAYFDTIITNIYENGYVYMTKYYNSAFSIPYIPENQREAQTIEWDQELQFSLADSPIALTAVSTSGLPVSYACSDTNIARVVGSTLHLLSEGDASVTASQPGNSQYRPADPVTKLLHVSSTGIAQGERPVLAVYPNPARDAVYCYYAGERVRQVTVVTSTGVVADVPIAGGKVDISTLPNGVYYMTFVTESNIYQHKIIKL